MKLKRILSGIILTIIFSLLIGLIAISVLAKDEGTLGDNMILNFMADYLYLFAVPAIIIAGFLAQTHMNNILFFGISILIVALFYTWITVWVIRKYKDWKIE